MGAAGAVAVPSLSALLTACGGKSSPGGSTAPTTVGTKADPTAILRFGQMRGESFDPIRLVAVEYLQLNVLFDTLLSISRDDGSVQPRLATEWSVTSDAIRLKLRPGVTFQDGTPFNADAVKFSMERGMKDPASNIKARFSNVSAVNVVDPMTVD